MGTGIFFCSHGQQNKTDKWRPEKKAPSIGEIKKLQQKVLKPVEPKRVVCGICRDNGQNVLPGSGRYDAPLRERGSQKYVDPTGRISMNITPEVLCEKIRSQMAPVCFAHATKSDPILIGMP